MVKQVIRRDRKQNIDNLNKLLTEWVDKKKFGKIVINFYGGSIQSVEKRETIKI